MNKIELKSSSTEAQSLEQDFASLQTSTLALYESPSSLLQSPLSPLRPNSWRLARFLGFQAAVFLCLSGKITLISLLFFSFPILFGLSSLQAMSIWGRIVDLEASESSNRRIRLLNFLALFLVLGTGFLLGINSLPRESLWFGRLSFLAISTYAFSRSFQHLQRGSHILPSSSSLETPTEVIKVSGKAQERMIRVRLIVAATFLLGLVALSLLALIGPSARPIAMASFPYLLSTPLFILVDFSAWEASLEIEASRKYLA